MEDFIDMKPLLKDVNETIEFHFKRCLEIIWMIIVI